MKTASRVPRKRKLAAYVLPMLIFVAFLALDSGLKKVGGAFWVAHSEYWIFPLQTILCAVVLFWFRQEYDFKRFRGAVFTFAVGIFVFFLWISPQAFLGLAPRLDGFNPDLFSGQPGFYWPTVMVRFLRLVVIVPLVEEIFWRGFLLRYLIHERFDTVPLGAFSWLSFVSVTIAFCLAHGMADWPAAIVTGALYNIVLYRTKSLTSCIIAHATTNLLLGVWIMQTRQWGFW